MGPRNETLSSSPTRSAMLPCRRSRPWATTTTWSARRSTSSMRCVVRTIVVPSSTSARTRSWKARRPRASRPAVGSSRKASRGRPTRAAAVFTRCCSPPESRLMVVRVDGSMPRPSSSVCGVVGVRVERGDVPHELERAGGGVQAAVLQHDADARVRRCGPVGHVAAQDLHGAAGPRAQADADLDGRRLARPVGADERRHLPRGGLEGQPGDRRPGAVADHEVTDADG